MFSGYGFGYCNWKENAPRQSQIHRGNKTKGSIILGTRCPLLSLVQPHATLEDTKMPTTMVGQLFSGVKFLNQSGLSSCACLSNCRGACCLHVFTQSSSQDLTPVAGVGCLLGLISVKRKSVPLKAKASGPRDGELCSMGSIFTAASFCSASLSQIIFKNNGILACARGEENSSQCSLKTLGIFNSYQCPSLTFNFQSTGLQNELRSARASLTSTTQTRH